MHIAEGYLPAVHCAAWYVASAPFVIHGAREVIRESQKSPENRLLLAAAGAFTFVLSAIKLPSVTGSSSHPTGTGLGAVLFKPPVMAFLCTIVLIFQAILLAHGGLTTLGANVFSMGIAGPWAGYAVYMALKAAPGSVRVFFAMFFADLITYVVTSFQLAIAYPDPATGLMGAATKFLSIFALSQLPLAIMEGFIGVLVFRYLSQVAAPQLNKIGLYMTPEQKLQSGVSNV